MTASHWQNLRGAGIRIVGFVTVSAGQLAVDKQMQGQDIGQDLLAFVLRLAIEFSQRIGLYAVLLDAKHPQAAAFYRQLGFIATLDNPLTLFLPLTTLERAQG